MTGEYRHHHHRQDAFTLVEMLVVIAVIGILASLLMPALGRALESARGTYCANNLRQVGFGVSLYVSANNESLPPKYYGTGAADYWIHNLVNYYLVQEYRLNEKFWLCPSRNAIFYLPAGNGSTTYGCNFVLKNASACLSTGWTKVTRLKYSPSKSILFLDAEYQECNIWLTDRWPEPRHNGRVNVLYADGSCISPPKLPLVNSDYLLY